MPQYAAAVVPDYVGQEAYITAMYAYHENKSYNLGVPFDQYVEELVAFKARRFTIPSAVCGGESDGRSW